ncbi:MAG: hypothetical protein GX033_07325 [Firmicutes bacterium]|nr:hypothetical protein [Bacillota bacterium]
MAEKDKLAVQRNKLDVALELTHLYYSERLVDNVEQIQKVFTRFYAIADLVERMDADDFVKLVPEELARLWQVRN